MSGATRTPPLDWFALHADSLDGSDTHADEVVTQLGTRGLLRIGVPAALNGDGGTTADAVEAIAQVARHSLTSAFVFWGQRAFIEFLLHTPNTDLRERWLPALLDGSLAGATGLSNAMKFLSGIESLQVAATPLESGWQLDGKLPWVTNLRRSGFVVAAAVAHADGPPSIIALSSDQAGVTRSDDLDLVALRGSNTAAVDIGAVRIDATQRLHDNALAFCPFIRPAFLGLQCGLSIGLARASLAAAREHGSQGAHAIVMPRVEALDHALEQAVAALYDGLGNDRFRSVPAELFRLRIHLADLVQQSAGLELQASGGRAYLLSHNRDFVRRWREAAFVPVVTPSLTQLQGELAKHAAAQAS